MLTSKQATARSKALSPDLATYTLKSRAAGETGYAANVSWKGQEQPATLDDLSIAGAIVGETWKIVELFLEAQTVMPKELDLLSDGTSTYVIKSLSRQQGENIFRVRGLLATTP